MIRARMLVKKTILRTTLPLFLLGVFLYTVFGYYFAFELSRAGVHKEIRTQLQQHRYNVTTLIVPDAAHNPEFRRVEAKEIEFQGRMYDVVREVRTGNETKFYCIHDTREENIQAGLKRAVNSNLMLTLMFHILIQAVPEEAPDEIPAYQAEVEFPVLVMTPLARPALPLSPPPEYSFPS
jgi:hypothetical protein